MRVALLSGNARRHNAIGNQIAEKVRFFQERGAEVRVFVQDVRHLHPDLHAVCVEVPQIRTDGPVWDFLRNADLVIAVYAEHHELLQYLPCLAGVGPRIVLDYHGVTPSALSHPQQREGLDQSARQRGYVWCADHALTTSQANRRELLEATYFPSEHTTTLSPVVDVERFSPEPHDRFLQQRLGIEGRILLFVGRLAGNKRVPLLIEALARLEDCAAHVVILGDIGDVYAEEAVRCQTLARQLGVFDRVHFLGQLEDAELAHAYRSADVLVMPSLHEGFCVPVIEAMASGLPVIASRSAALPETVGAAGLTFTPNDVEDLVRQLRRVLSARTSHSAAMVRPRRVVVVSFRFGSDIVGGAETSLRIMAKSLQDAGHHVEVFTTCAKSESRWKNDVPAGCVTLDGLVVNRFLIDPHDPVAHGETVRAILEADGNVSTALEHRYLETSIHSSALIETLRQRLDEFDAVITGPYLFGLTADVAKAFAAKTLLVPCFHDESLVRLKIWQQKWDDVSGILYHSWEEQNFAQQTLGINHPNAWELGTCMAISPEAAPTTNPAPRQRPYVVYCGRYSEQKNVPMLLDWMCRYQAERLDELDFVLMGQGEFKPPSEPWLHNLGRVEESVKRSVLAGAKALVQLSTQESLSLVALEAWAVGTPVIAHRDCAVLVGQIERSEGGIAVADYATFSAALDDVQDNEITWQARGTNGRAYVDQHYASTKDYVERLTNTIDRMHQPLGAQMRERGLARAQEFSRASWQRRFAEFIEQLLTQSARLTREVLRIEPLRADCRAISGSRTLLLPVRLINAGTHAAVPDGPGCTVVYCEIRTNTRDGELIADDELRLPALLAPGQTQVAALPIPLPIGVGSYRLFLWMESMGADKRVMPNRVELQLTIDAEQTTKFASCASAFLDTVQEILPRTNQLQQLPDDYVDVTEGRLAPVKSMIKRKLLNNFKHAYVDVLSRQQSEVNGQVVVMIQQLAECCAMLDHAVAGLHERMDGLETRMEQMMHANEIVSGAK